MRLSLHTDFALRALIYLASMREDATTAAAIASGYGISKNHLVKVLQRLRDLGYVETVRGRGGGVRLTADPEQIRLGEVVRKTEVFDEVVECFNPERNTCPIVSVCRLPRGLGEAVEAFLAVLDRYTLSDVASNKDALNRILGR